MRLILPSAAAKVFMKDTDTSVYASAPFVTDDIEKQRQLILAGVVDSDYCIYD